MLSTGNILKSAVTVDHEEASAILPCRKRGSLLRKSKETSLVQHPQEHSSGITFQKMNIN